MYLPLDKLMEGTGGARTTTGSDQFQVSPVQEKQETTRGRTSSRDGGSR